MIMFFGQTYKRHCGVVDMLSVSIKLDHRNFRFLNDSEGTQHSLLSPLDYLSAKADGTVEAARGCHIYFTADWFKCFCYFCLTFFGWANSQIRHIYIIWLRNSI